MDKVKIILVGAGGRGSTYVKEGQKYCPEMELVAVADPNPVRRDYIKELFRELPEDRFYEYGEDLLAQPKMADAAIIATQYQSYPTYADTDRHSSPNARQQNPYFQQ